MDPNNQQPPQNQYQGQEPYQTPPPFQNQAPDPSTYQVPLQPQNYQQAPQYQAAPEPTNYGPRPKKALDNPLEVMQPGERVICHIRRHPFGLIGIYMASGLIVLAALVAAILLPRYVTGMTAQDKTGLYLGAVVLVALVALYTYIVTVIYNGNRWIVSSDSITQITQVGLFRKQTSQLSLGNLEDVTFEQESLIQTLFGFGTLHVETAGEHSKFVFPFCPTPQQCAKEIIKAHEEYIAANPEHEYRGNYGLNQFPNQQNQNNFGATNPPV